MSSKAIVSSEKITAIANAIRAKTGKTETMTLDDMPTEITSIEGSGGGGGSSEDEVGMLLSDTLTNIKCNATLVREYIFRGSAGLVSIDLPEATTIESYAFYGCTKLAEINFPKVTKIGSNVFYQCNGIETVNLPSLVSAGSTVFYQCSGITSAYVPLLETISNTYFFRDCSYLEKADFPKLTSIAANAFNGCRSLEVLILRANTVASLANTNAFANCYRILGTKNAGFNPTGKKTGFIYVPSALVEDYKVATNWSNFATQFRAIEDYPEITGG